MRTRIVLSSVCVIVIAASTAKLLSGVAPAPSVAGHEPAAMSALRFMSGCWQGPSRGGAMIEEYYTSPSSNIMLGTTRYIKDGRTTDYELTLIDVGQKGPVMRPHPKGKEPGEFIPVDIGHGSATWEDPAIEFPRRIIYRHLAPDSLIARIEGKSADHAIEWRMGRVTCAGS